MDTMETKWGGRRAKTLPSKPQDETFGIAEMAVIVLAIAFVGFGPPAWADQAVRAAYRFGLFECSAAVSDGGSIQFGAAIGRYDTLIHAARSAPGADPAADARCASTPTTPASPQSPASPKASVAPAVRTAMPVERPE